MPPTGSSSDNKAQTAPPRESLARIQRTGYILLAASGLVLTTAFAAIAQVTNQNPSDASSSQHDSAPKPGSQVIPGHPVPGQGTLTINGAAVAGELPTSSSTPTTVVQVDRDGRVTTTILTPPANPPGSTPGTTDQPSEPPTTSEPTTVPTTPTTPSEPSTSNPPSSHPSTPPSTPDSPTSSSTSGTSSPSNSTTKTTNQGGGSTAG